MGRRDSLTSEELAAGLDELSGWAVEDGRLVRGYRFPDFKAALAFVVQVGCLAERMDHHPDLELGWGRVAVTLWTHDADAITGLDLRLARGIEGLRG